MVRAEAFRAIGGFTEGVRTAEDTDLCWRLQQAGWRLELRAAAEVGHVYRDSLPALRRQWRAYAAGRAWLAERYPDFHPEPAARRALRRLVRRRPAPRSGPPPANLPASNSRHSEQTRRQRLQFRLIDALLAVDELIGLRQDNRI